MPKMLDITVPIPTELHRYLLQKVQDGDYLDAGDVVREALYVLKQHDDFQAFRQQQLREQIEVGLDESRRGLSRPFDAAAVRRIKAEGRKRLARRRNGKR